VDLGTGSKSLKYITSPFSFPHPPGCSPILLIQSAPPSARPLVRVLLSDARALPSHSATAASRAGAEHIAEGNHADMVAGFAASKSLAHPRAWQLPPSSLLVPVCHLHRLNTEEEIQRPDGNSRRPGGGVLSLAPLCHRCYSI
jgi:hypothetical protein